MMRLQRVGRRNDPSYRIVVTNKRTGPKSDKHVDRIGSYNPKQNHIQIDADKAKEWLAKGVQPSDTMHNILVSEKIIDAKKINVLPRKSPIIDEEAIKAEAEAKAAKEAEATKEAEVEVSEESAEGEAPAEEPKAEVPSEEESASETKEEEKAEEPKEEEKTEDETKKE